MLDQECSEYATNDNIIVNSQIPRKYRFNSYYLPGVLFFTHYFPDLKRFRELQLDPYDKIYSYDKPHVCVCAIHMAIPNTALIANIGSLILHR